MGTTETNLGSATTFTLVAAIEGYPTLIASDTEGVTTAYAAGDWTGAIGGLEIQGTMDQRIDPWSVDLEPTDITLHIKPDASDTFGKACNQGGGGVQTYLETAVTGSTTSIVGTDTSGFDSPSGTIYIGCEAITYTGNSGTTLSGCTRGIYHPASRDSETLYQFGRNHATPTSANDPLQKPIITSVPRVWIGKHVGVYLHRVVANHLGARVLDTVAEASLIFYGTIESIEDTEDGTTLLGCVDIREQLNRTVLLNDQWTAQVPDGIYVADGVRFNFEIDYSTGGSGFDDSLATTLDSVTEGTYTAEEIAEELTNWLINDSAISTYATVTFAVNEDGYFEINAADVGTYSTTYIRFYTTRYLLRCLGWPEFVTDTWAGYASVKSSGNDAISPERVVRAIGFGGSSAGGYYNQFSVNHTGGTWWNNQAYLPNDIAGLTVSGENWGVVSVGSSLFVARWDSDSLLDRLLPIPGYSDLMGGKTFEVSASHGDDGKVLEVKQIVMIQDSFANVIGRLFRNTGDSAYNWADDGDYPAQIGAGIPYSICDASFDADLDTLGEASAADSMTVVLDKPTKLWDAIAGDLLLRLAYLVFKSGELRFTTAISPHSSISVHTWGEGQKQANDPSDRQRTVSRTTEDYLRNVIKIKYNRRALNDDGYGSTIEIRYTRSIQDHGERVQSIEAPNAFGLAGNLSVESLASEMAMKLLPLYGRPLKLARRPIELADYEGVAPGDVALVTDPHMRDPADGTRGVTSKPALVLSHSHSYTPPLSGEVEIIYLDLDTVSIYSPTAEVTAYAADGSNGSFTCSANAFSDAAADGDTDVDNFADNDEIIVYERDPDDPASPQTLSTTVFGTPSSNTIKTDDLFPGYDSNKKYYIVSDTYANAATTQRTDCYYADTDDAQVADLRNPFTYAGPPPGTLVTKLTGNELAERHSNAAFADGSPVSTGVAWGLAKNANAICNRSTAIHTPLLFSDVVTCSLPDYELITIYPIRIGPPYFPGSKTRTLTFAPLMRTTVATEEVYLRVTLSRYRPKGDSPTTTVFATPFEQFEFTTDSATFATATTQSYTITQGIVNGSGSAWLTLEGKISALYAGDLKLWGLSKFYMGRLD